LPLFLFNEPHKQYVKAFHRKPTNNTAQTKKVKKVKAHEMNAPDFEAASINRRGME
jgi:hypothetical protein